MRCDLLLHKTLRTHGLINTYLLSLKLPWSLEMQVLNSRNVGRGLLSSSKAWPRISNPNPNPKSRECCCFCVVGLFFFLLFFLMSEKETHHTETVQMFYVHLMEHNFIIFFRTSQNTRPTLYVSLECGMIQGTDRGNVQLASETSLTSLSTGPSGQNHDKSFYVNIHPNMDN